ncbi:MAG: hypothetical protein Q8K37_00370, partial [Alphaproteobacteria bacterium]|nr:hypothetical protein [Alphaproteobacteria bacterium]
SQKIFNFQTPKPKRLGHIITNKFPKVKATTFAKKMLTNVQTVINSVFYDPSNEIYITMG